MYLSLNAVPIGGNLSWRQFAELASTTGFTGVDVMLDAAMADGVEVTVRMFRELNLRPACVGLPVEFRQDDETFRATMPRLEDAARFSAAIGCPRMLTYIMPSSDTPKEELRRIYKARFSQIAEVVARSHCRLGLEFLGPQHFRTQHQYEFIWNMNEMLEFAKECGSNVGLLLDSWHWHHSGATPEDIIAAGKDRIVGVHLNDSADLAPEDVRDDERMLPGEGVIDLTAFLGALHTIGYEDGLSIEVFGRGLNQMAPDRSARICLEAGRKTLRAHQRKLNMQDPSKKIALVTGANKGIGFEVVRQIAASGCTVLLGARNPELGEQAAAKLAAEALDVRYLAIDVTVPAMIAAAAKRIDDEFERLDILVNNAGIAVPGDGPPSACSLEAIARALRVNFLGSVAVTQAMLPLLRRAPSARIVNVSSGIGSLTQNCDPAYPFVAVKNLAYCSSKAALNMLTVQLAYELRDTAIKVNSVDPGYTATDINGFSGTQTVPEGAAETIRLALLPDDGPTGTYSDSKGIIPW